MERQNPDPQDRREQESTKSKKEKQTLKKQDEINEAGQESFPASDPPAWNANVADKEPTKNSLKDSSTRRH